MIRTVQDLRRALDAYPDDTAITIYGYPFGRFCDLELYRNLDHSLVVDAHSEPEECYTEDFEAFVRAEVERITGNVPPLEEMTAGEDGWSDWVHPLPGYLIGCCDCGLVHEMEFAIDVPQENEEPSNAGETKAGIITFRARRYGEDDA